jgi:DNA-binding NtrC family response regulator
MPTNKKIKILLIEDEDFDVRRVRNTIKYFNGQITIKDVVSTGYEAIDLLNENPNDYDVVIMDFQIAGGLRGESLITKIKEIDSSLQIIVITKMTINITDFEFANSLMKAGAFWYCTKYPGDIEDSIYQPTDFLMSIFNAYEKKQLETQKLRTNKKLSENIESIMSKKNIFGISESTNLLRQQIEKYANSDANILISGPSGTGKELVASNLHYRSKRKFENFVPINCGSLPRELIESELFGYEKGAFTGANSKKPGLFEIANNGTLFLDEVAELPQSAQVKLLRVIQEGEIEKIGRTKSIVVNVRIIAATNKYLEHEVREGRFREDLYYRLNVVPLYVLPLNQRREDIQPLVIRYLEYYCQDMSKQMPEFTDSAMRLLTDYDWPGNVRELKNVVQRLLLDGGDLITESDVRKSLITKMSDIKHVLDYEQVWLQGEPLQLRELEKQVRIKYVEFIRKNSKSDAEASLKLGIAPSNYNRMCKELGLK